MPRSRALVDPAAMKHLRAAVASPHVTTNRTYARRIACVLAARATFGGRRSAVLRRAAIGREREVTRGQRRGYVGAARAARAARDRYGDREGNEDPR